MLTVTSSTKMYTSTKMLQSRNGLIMK